MDLYIGGYAQGKKEYARKQAETPEQKIIDNVHLWFKQLLEEEKNPGEAEQVILSYCDLNPDVILICDEIGNGIIPMEKKERDYRERLGRLLIELAGKADHVERIICGLGQRLK